MVIHIQSLHHQICVYICTYSSQFRDIGQPKEIKKTLQQLWMLCAKEIFLHAILGSSGLDTLLTTVLADSIVLWKWKDVEFKKKQSLIFMCCSSNSSYSWRVYREIVPKVIRICPLTMTYKFGPGDLVQRSQLGDVGMMGEMVLKGVCYG